MRICIFSDIHGNGFAFREAYEKLLGEKADLNIFVGDLCGYYFDQVSILQALKSIPNLLCVKGNHDEVFLQIFGGNKQLQMVYRDKYGRSMEHLLQNGSEEIAQWLSDIPRSLFLEEWGLFICHGNPWSLLEGYVYPDSDLKKFSTHPAEIFILGHTHHPMERYMEGKMIVNPGSLGQPRSKTWPSYAILDIPERKTTFRHVHYEKNRLLSQIEEVGDNNPYIRNVLNQ